MDDAQLRQDGRISFAVRKFSPLGRSLDVPEGPWIWILRFDSSRVEGREATDSWIEAAERGSSYMFGTEAILLRRDRAPADALERRLYDRRQ